MKPVLLILLMLQLPYTIYNIIHEHYIQSILSLILIITVAEVYSKIKE